MSTNLLGTVDRYFVGVQLLVVGVVAVVAGWTGASVAGSMLIPEGRARARSSQCSDCDWSGDGPERLQASGVDVEQRNPFCSACAKRSTPKAVTRSKSSPRLDDAVLVATQVAAGDTGWTLAEVRFPGAGQLRVLGKGSQVADAKITRVTATQVAFVRRGQTGVLQLLPGLAAAPLRLEKSTPSSGCPASVRSLGPGKFAIDRSLLLSLMQGLGGGTHDVAVAPLHRKGRLAGLRIHRVRPQSVFHCLGLRSRDQVTAVNNRQLTSPDVLLTLMAELPGARHVTVAIIRHGRPRTLDFSID